MADLYILIGLPASGKSTWALKNKDDLNFEILSSDALRQELFNDINDQTHNDKVFREMHKRARNFLAEGCNVCYDATNINRKDRSAILNIGKSLNATVIAVMFEVPVEECLTRNRCRDRVVPDNIILKMLKRFEIPFIEEGFDKIISIFDKNRNYNHWYESIEKLIDFDQRNPHHTLTLDKHCFRCEDYILSKNDEYDIQPELCMAALFHDYGKLFTQTWDEEKQCCHYYNHENVGAYFLFFIHFPDYIDRYKVIFYVNYHMEPYRIEKANENKKNRLIKSFKEEWLNIMLLHEGDEYAH